MSDDLELVERALARAVTPQAREGVVERRQGVIDAVNAGGTVDVEVGEVVIPGVRYKAWYNPAVGDTVFVEVVGTDFVVDGPLLGTRLPSAVERIYDLTTGAPVASFSITGIPQIYRHLELEVKAKSVAGGGGLLLRFNNDSGAGYDYVFDGGAGDGTDLGGGGSGTAMDIGPFAATGGLGRSATHAIIHDYATSGTRIALIATSHGYSGDSAAGMQVFSNSGQWRPATLAPVTAITLLNSAGVNFAGASQVTLYGKR